MTGAALKAGTDFEQLNSDGLETSLSQLGFFKCPAAKQNQELISERKKLEPKGIGCKGVAGKSMGLKIAFDFFDPVLTFAALVIPGNDLFGTAGSVGNEKPHVGSQVADFNFDDNASLFSPRFGPVPEAIAAANRSLAAGVLALGLLKPALGLFLKDLIRSDPHGIGESQRFQSFVDLWRCRTRIGSVAELGFGETLLKDRHQPVKLLRDVARSMRIARA